ncbi:uncharacterized protein BDZ99DRAFT_519647 [Mytilinidion resinicola]|uniref:Apple domain-containing protein n=1 Tax=Mytilinidion resinicola TaxID=574789 RepID=A0A6A6YQB8_9PEZI|nr:uncharacterized protein BDZ99DRAFT_519647 [Mytilinidion resinicola]KAF2810980.1 hypothetical protein BDZ99DRAFT_519647 [Mytilinidion resinicola]
MVNGKRWALSSLLAISASIGPASASKQFSSAATTAAPEAYTQRYYGAAGMPAAQQAWGVTSAPSYEKHGQSTCSEARTPTTHYQERRNGCSHGGPVNETSHGKLGNCCSHEGHLNVTSHGNHGNVTSHRGHKSWCSHEGHSNVSWHGGHGNGSSHRGHGGPCCGGPSCRSGCGPGGHGPGGPGGPGGEGPGGDGPGGGNPPVTTINSATTSTTVTTSSSPNYAFPVPLGDNTNISCPKDNATCYQTGSGQRYVILCNVDIYGHDFELANYQTFNECLQDNDTESEDCKAVTFVPGATKMGTCHSKEMVQGKASGPDHWSAVQVDRCPALDTYPSSATVHPAGRFYSTSPAGASTSSTTSNVFSSTSPARASTPSSTTLETTLDRSSSTSPAGGLTPSSTTSDRSSSTPSPGALTSSSPTTLFTSLVRGSTASSPHGPGGAWGTSTASSPYVSGGAWGTTVATGPSGYTHDTGGYYTKDVHKPRVSGNTDWSAGQVDKFPPPHNYNSGIDKHGAAQKFAARSLPPYTPWTATTTTAWDGESVRQKYTSSPTVSKTEAPEPGETLTKHWFCEDSDSWAGSGNDGCWESDDGEIYVISCGIGFPASDIVDGTYDNISRDQCFTKCDEDRECKLFTFVPGKQAKDQKSGPNGTCYTKWKQNPPTQDTAVWSGAKVNKCSLSDNTYELGEKKYQGSADGAVLLPLWYNICNPRKSDFSIGKGGCYQTDDGKFYNVSCGFELSSSEHLTSFDFQTSGECVQDCVLDANCMGFTYHPGNGDEGNCILKGMKDSLSPPIENPNVWSGVSVENCSVNHSPLLPNPDIAKSAVSGATSLSSSAPTRTKLFRRGASSTSSSTIKVAAEPRVSATSLKTHKTPLTCPEANGKCYKSEESHLYTVLCGRDFVSTYEKDKKSSEVKSMNECISECDQKLKNLDEVCGALTFTFNVSAPETGASCLTKNRDVSRKEPEYELPPIADSPRSAVAIRVKDCPLISDVEKGNWGISGKDGVIFVDPFFPHLNFSDVRNTTSKCWKRVGDSHVSVQVC